MQNGHSAFTHQQAKPGFEPRLVAWEVTRKCNLNCVHCRAGADRGPYPGELDTRKCLEILDQIRQVGNPIIILTGGEPLLREDVFELATKGTRMGLRVVMATNGTLFTPRIIEQMKASGIKRVSISIDGADAGQHDAFRKVAGAYDRAMAGIAMLRENNFDFQINTTVTRHNAHDLEAILSRSVQLGAAAHHLFLLVPTGRAREMVNQEIDARAYEKILHWFYRTRDRMPLHLKATCAPHYYRILRQKARKQGESVDFETYGLDAVTRGCLGGTAFCFISNTGIVQPCGYLERHCGDLKESSFPDVWRNSEIFQDLRDFSKYEGKCGRCEYIRHCGGCRARAFEATGNYLAEEPLCAYQPERVSAKSVGAASRRDCRGETPLSQRNCGGFIGGSVMDDRDRKILNEIQSDFPISSRPYRDLAERLHLTENEVIESVRKLKERGIIRRIGGNFHSSELDFVSTLCAASVPEDKIENFVKTVNAYPGVTHNYLRSHTYNIWFTFIAQHIDIIDQALASISAETGVKDILNLPAEKMFKIKVDFEI